MNLFPIQPKTTKADAVRLLPHVASEKTIRLFLKTNPSIDDLKRCVRLEVLHRGPRVRASILDKLLVRLQQLERTEIIQNITDYLSTLKKP